MTDLFAGVIQVVWEYPVVLKPHLDAGKLIAHRHHQRGADAAAAERADLRRAGLQGSRVHRLGDHLGAQGHAAADRRQARKGLQRHAR